MRGEVANCARVRYKSSRTRTDARSLPGRPTAPKPCTHKTGSLVSSPRSSPVKWTGTRRECYDILPRSTRSSPARDSRLANARFGIPRTTSTPTTHALKTLLELRTALAPGSEWTKGCLAPTSSANEARRKCRKCVRTVMSVELTLLETIRDRVKLDPSLEA